MDIEHLPVNVFIVHCNTARLVQQIIYTNSDTVDLIPVWPSITLDMIANLSFY